ncbi:MAG: TetR/AcrR family transcriptional regulator [Syntrophorhabdales bacterium]|jgi:AcrR family transcriptional regulator
MVILEAAWDEPEGDKTKQRIIEAAEELFSKNGFHATSVSQITKKAHVNKAALYYHFKDKNDLILSLFQKILNDLAASEVSRAATPAAHAEEVATALREEISFLTKRKDIFAVMLMESFKSQDPDMSLFKCAEVAMRSVSGNRMSAPQLVHEFFTGFIPLIAFVVLRDKWCEFFRCDKDEVLEQFVEFFAASHVATHPHSG